MKYGSDGFDDCASEVAVAVFLRSGLEKLPVRLINELPTYKSPNQQDPPCETNMGGQNRFTKPTPQCSTSI